MSPLPLGAAPRAALRVQVMDRTLPSDEVCSGGITRPPARCEGVQLAAIAPGAAEIVQIPRAKSSQQPWHSPEPIPLTSESYLWQRRRGHRVLVMPHMVVAVACTMSPTPAEDPASCAVRKQPGCARRCMPCGHVGAETCQKSDGPMQPCSEAPLA